MTHVITYCHQPSCKMLSLTDPVDKRENIILHSVTYRLSLYSDKMQSLFECVCKVNVYFRVSLTTADSNQSS